MGSRLARSSRACAVRVRPSSRRPWAVAESLIAGNSSAAVRSRPVTPTSRRPGPRRTPPSETSRRPIAAVADTVPRCVLARKRASPDPSSETPAGSPGSPPSATGPRSPSARPSPPQSQVPRSVSGTPRTRAVKGWTSTRSASSTTAARRPSIGAPGRSDARRLERSRPPREAFAARQAVAQLHAVERPRGEGERAHVGLPGDDRPIPRPRRFRGHARRSRNARRAHGTRERSEIGVEVRAEPQAAPRLHAARDVEPRSGPPRGHRPELDPAPFEPAFGLHVRRAEGREGPREPEPVQREVGPSRAGSPVGAQGEGAPDGPAREVSANVPKVQGPVSEASLEVDTSRAKRSRGELGHGDATLDPRARRPAPRASRRTGRCR